MRELGYVYDRVAANLRSQTSTTVGLIITDISNTFFSEFLIGVQNTLEEVGLTVLLGTTFDSVAKQEQLISTMLEHRVGGLILCPVSGTAEETLSRLERLDIPVVLAVRRLPMPTVILSEPIMRKAPIRQCVISLRKAIRRLRFWAA